MTINFSGLCVFDGWKKDGPATKEGVRVILTKSTSTRPHLPLLAVGTHRIRSMSRPGDFAFVGHKEREFMAWRLPSKLTLPSLASGDPVMLSGSERLIDLGFLAEQSKGTPAIDPKSGNEVCSVIIKHGEMKAIEATATPVAQWKFAAGAKVLNVPGSPTKTIIVADRVAYDPKVGSLADHTIEFEEPGVADSKVTLKVSGLAEIWITNLSLIAVPHDGKNDRLSDVGMHYELLKAPLVPIKQRFIPILQKASSITDVNTDACVHELCRI